MVKINYKYGMLSRPFSIGCQPKGCIDVIETDKLIDGFWNILIYDRELTDEEIESFELKEIN